MTIVQPQVLVFQQFRTLPSELTDPLRAFIFGPEYQLHRYNVASEKVKAGDYDPITGLALDWLTDLGRRAGAVPDPTYSKVYLENARLQYFESTAGAQFSSSNYTTTGYISTPINSKNKIRFSTLNLVDKTGFTLDGVFAGRSVQLGDYAGFSINLNGNTYTGGGKVIGFEADAIAATVGTAASASANQATNLSSAPAIVEIGTTPGGKLTVGGTYDGIADGVVNETYTIEVVRGTVNLDPSTAVVNITSASGKDTVVGFRPSTTVYAADIPLGGNGLTFRFAGGANIEAGYKWSVTVGQAFTAPNATAGGTYTGPSNTTYIVTVLRGGDVTESAPLTGQPDLRPLIQVTTSTGIDSEPPKIGAPGAVGNYGVTISWNQDILLAGDQYYIPVTAQGEGAIRTIIIDRSLPAEMVTTNANNVRGLSATLSIQKNMELPSQIFNLGLSNWSQDADTITLEAGARDYDSSWENGEVALPIVHGEVYIHWRELIADHTDRVYEIGTLGDLTSEFDTPIDPDNPLVYAASKALSNSGSSLSPSTGIRLMAVASDDITGYTNVLEIAEGRDDLYTFVPLTYDRAIQNLVVAHVQTQSTPEIGLWRIAMLCTEEQNPMPVIVANEDDSPLLATTDSSRNLDLHPSSTAQFITSGVRSGDTVRANYGTDLYGETIWVEYKVDVVVSETRLRLVTAPSPVIGTPSKIEVWRVPTGDDIVESVGTKASTFGNRRIFNVYPSKVKSGGVMVPGFHLCAALAGLIGASVPQQGMTNVEIVGFDDMRNVIDRFNRSQLDNLANYGVWIVTQDLRTGDIYTRHQLSTDTTDVNSRELSVIKNVDSISYYFRNILKPYIGRANITATSIEVIRTQIDGGISALSTVGFSPILGGQVLDGTKIRELRQHAVLRDRLVAVLDLVVPYPLNNVELYLVV